MYESYIFAVVCDEGSGVFLHYALHVHEARRIGPRDILCSGGDVAAQLVAAHAQRDVGLFDGEHPSEAAAFVRTLRLADGDVGDEIEEVADFVKPADVALGGRRQSEFSHSVAAVVYADGVGEAGSGQR